MTIDSLNVDQIKGLFSGGFEVYSKEEKITSVIYKRILSSTMLFELANEKYCIKRQSFWSSDYTVQKNDTRVAEVINKSTYSYQINIKTDANKVEKFTLQTDGKWFFTRFILKDKSDREILIFNIFRESWLSDLDLKVEDKYIDQIESDRDALIIYAAFCCYKIYAELHDTDFD